MNKQYFVKLSIALINLLYINLKIYQKKEILNFFQKRMQNALTIKTSPMKNFLFILIKFFKSTKLNFLSQKTIFFIEVCQNMKEEMTDDIEEKKYDCNLGLCSRASYATSSIQYLGKNANMPLQIHNFSNGNAISMLQFGTKLKGNNIEDQQRNLISINNPFSTQQLIHQIQKCSINKYSKQSVIPQQTKLSSCIQPIPQQDTPSENCPSGINRIQLQAQNEMFQILQTAYRIKKTKKIKRIKNLIILKKPETILQNPTQKQKTHSSYDFKNLSIKQHQSWKTLKNIQKQNNQNNNRKKRNGKSIQSLTQKFIKKVSGYHYSKNYKQQRDNYEKKILFQTQKPMTLENFKQKLESYNPKVNKKLNFLAIFKDADEKRFVELLYRNCVKLVYVLMYETELRRPKKVEIKSGEVCEEKKIEIKSCRRSKNELDPCLDDEGNKQLSTIFDRIFQESVAEFRKLMQKLGRTWSFEAQNIKQLLIRNLQF